MELLLEIKQKKNLTILLITHDLQLAQAAADQALIFKNGNLEKADINEHSLVTELF